MMLIASLLVPDDQLIAIDLMPRQVLILHFLVLQNLAHFMLHHNLDIANLHRCAMTSIARICVASTLLVDDRPVFRVAARRRLTALDATLFLNAISRL